MKKRLITLLLLIYFNAADAQYKKISDTISLAGKWSFQIDSLDLGVKENWFEKSFTDEVILPGSMTTNGKGNDVTVNTKWTGGYWNAAWFKDSIYAPYRKEGNIKISFWLQPVKHYVGAAWYKKIINIPPGWQQQDVELFLERCHWETIAWIDDKLIGMQNALGTPHQYVIPKGMLVPGMHSITLRIDNRIKEINPGADAHSISDNTQTNWNGIIGNMHMVRKAGAYLMDAQVFPDVAKKNIHVKITINNSSGKQMSSRLLLDVSAINFRADLKNRFLQKNIFLDVDTTTIEIDYPMGQQPSLWDEFHPNLYSLKVVLKNTNDADVKNITFGMRSFATRGTQFTINDRPVFLRGTLECAIFPKTGYPPTDTAAWNRIFSICRSYGLNHIRFHSWCPPEAAFDAADRAGFYLSVECSAWATVGDGEPIDQYVYDESNRIVKSFGNHPSFCMMPYGNEPGGKYHTAYLRGFVQYWKTKDQRRLYTTASGWPSIAENDYNASPNPRIQHWGDGVKSIINRLPPSTNYNWDSLLPSYTIPTVSHEIGQWCVYPNFKEIPKYDGVLKPKNFDIFFDRLKENHLDKLADSFLLASGKLQVLCYKADIEAALRTPGFGGFQLLDLHDFPGQGTALVGVLDPFWDDKGYVTANEYNRFCNSTVPLVRLSKMIFNNKDELNVPVEVAHFGEATLKNITPAWTITDANRNILFKGKLDQTDIAIGNGIKLGTIRQSLASVKKACKLTLAVTIGKYKNDWDIFVYPAALPAVSDEILVTQQLNDEAKQVLAKGGKVLFTIKKGELDSAKGSDIAIGFSSIFWNTSWTNNQPPHTLGILCNPNHPALKEFPSAYYSNWQWWDAMSHSSPVKLDAVANNLQPIVRVIDDWFTARSLGLIFECKAGNGKLLVSGIDFITDQEQRPAAKQLLYSLKKYMTGNQFNPVVNVDINTITSLIK